MSTNDDPFNLERFVSAQVPEFTRALAELMEGRKRSHWMWFIFPQLRDLGHSPTSRLYGISSLNEARAYLAHPLLGARLILCTEAVLAQGTRSLSAIFGNPDDLKFCSSMSLFALAQEKDKNLFRQALERYCDGRADPKTLELLGIGDN
jgi:uncharacterized protein (DUF1810 family)